MKRRFIVRGRGRPLALLLPAFWLLIACEKKDMLPKATQEGRNIFGCKIDGKPWVPDGGTGFQSREPILGGFFQIQKKPEFLIGIYIRTISKDKQEVHIYLDGYKEGEYVLNENTQTAPASLNPKNYGLYRNVGGGTTYVTSKQSTGKVVITKSDTATGVVAGTFEFVAGSPSGDKVTITNGRFDVNTRTL